MKENTEANVPLMDGENPEPEIKQESENGDEEKCPLKKPKKEYDINKEDIEDKEKLQSVLKRVEAKLNKDLIKEKQKRMNQDNEKEEGKEKYQSLEDLDFLLAFKENKDKKKYVCLLFTVFSICLPLFIIINLIGIFQIISVMNAIGEVIKRSIVCYLGWDDGEEESYYEFKNFYGFYFKSSIEEGIDYDLIETMSFLGTIFIKFYGFSVSSGFFMLINIIALFLIMNFFDEYTDVFERYTLLNIIYLIICYILLFVGVGSSALLSQQLLIENYEKYTLFYKLKSEGKKREKKNGVIQEIKEQDVIKEEPLEEDEEIKEKLIKDEDKKDEENKEEKKEEEIKVEENKEKKKKEEEKKDEEIMVAEEKKDEEKKEEEKKDEEKREDGKKEDGKKEDENEKNDEELKEPYFILVCVTSIIGFLFKYIFDIIISYYKYSFDGQYEDQLNGNTSAIDYNTTKSQINEEIFEHDKFLFYFIIIIYGGSIAISIGSYRLFKQVYEGDKKQNNQKDDEEDDGKRECNIFGYIIYLKQDKRKKYLEDNKTDKKAKKDNKKTLTVSVLVGGENKTAEDKKKDRNMCQRTKDKILNFIKQLYLCIRLMSDSFISWFNEIICPYFFCGNECCYCCCCCECCRKIVQEEEYELEEEYFCYCYKAKRHMKWFNRFIRDQTQKQILPLLLQYFIIQFNTVAFEKIFEENNEEGYNEFNDAKSIIYFILIFGTSLFLFFYLTISFGNIYMFYTRDKNQKLETKIKLGEMTGKLSNKILKGTYGIIIFNGFYSFIVSIICLLNDVNNNYVFYIPILINKFYYFTFAHQCAIYTDDDDEINYFTLATLLSIYLQVWDLFMDVLKKIPTNVLLFFQLLFSTVIIVISLFILVLLIFYIGKFMFTILYFISFLFSFGGFWFIYCYDKFKWEDKKFFKYKEYVPSTDVFGKDILISLKNKLITN